MRRLGIPQNARGVSGQFLLAEDQRRIPLPTLEARSAGEFLLVIDEAYRADETDRMAFGNEVYRYKRTPSAGEVARTAAGLLGVGGAMK